MKLMTMKQYAKMSKPALLRKIIKALRPMPKAKLARLCYNLTKSKLPRLKVRKSLAYNGLGFGESLKSMRKKKRKFSQRQLEAQRLFAKRAKAGTLRKRRR